MLARASRTSRSVLVRKAGQRRGQREKGASQGEGGGITPAARIDHGLSRRLLRLVPHLQETPPARRGRQRFSLRLCPFRGAHRCQGHPDRQGDGARQEGRPQDAGLRGRALVARLRGPRVGFRDPRADRGGAPAPQDASCELARSSSTPASTSSSGRGWFSLSCSCRSSPSGSSAICWEKRSSSSSFSGRARTGKPAETGT